MRNGQIIGRRFGVSGRPVLNQRDNPEQHDREDKHRVQVLRPRWSRRAEHADVIVVKPNDLAGHCPHGPELNAEEADGQRGQRRDAPADWSVAAGEMASRPADRGHRRHQVQGPE